MSFEFDYGADVTESSGIKRVNPEVGQQFGRLKSVIHLGQIIQVYKGKPKPPTNRVVLNFELIGNLLTPEDDDYISGLHPETGEPLNQSIAVNLTKGDNAKLTEVMGALVSKKEMEANTVKGFDDLIGRAVGLDIKGSDDKGEDGKPKYVDIATITAAPAALKAAMPPLKNPGVGHVRLSQLTIEALDECNPYMDVQNGMMKSEEWKAGTHPAIPLVEEIRKERPNYAKAKEKADNGSDAATANKPAETEKVDANEEF